MQGGGHPGERGFVGFLGGGEGRNGKTNVDGREEGKSFHGEKRAEVRSQAKELDLKRR